MRQLNIKGDCMTPELLAEIDRTLKFSYLGTDGLREAQKRTEILEYAKKYKRIWIIWGIC